MDYKDVEGGGNKFFRNVGKYLPIDTVSYLGRPEHLSTLF
jgi:hypothetical protein